MSVDISVSITEDIVDIIATPTVNIVNVTNSASIDPGLYDLSEFTNTSPNPFVRTSGLSSYVPTSRTLTINGTTQDLSADRTFTISTGITIGTTAIASGTVGRVLFEGTGNVVQESANLFWDNTNGHLGIGTSSPTAKLYLKGGTSDTFKVESTTNSLYNQFISTDGIGEFGIWQDAFYFQALSTLANGLRFYNGTTGVMQLSQAGNFSIGTTTDAGFRLDVNGTARVQGNATISINSNTGLITSVRNSNSGSSSSAEISMGNDLSAFIGSLATFSSTFSTLFVRNSICLISYAYDVLIGTNLNVASGGANVIKFATGGSNAAQERMRIFSTGNVAINTTTDAGFRLDVNGTARVKTLSITSNNANTAFQVSGSSDGNIRVGVPFTVTNYYSSNNHVFNNVNDTATFLTIASTGNLLLNTTTDVASSKFTIQSTTQGFLPPRMTTTQKNAIATPAAGLMVYDTTLNVISYYNGTSWI